MEIILILFVVACIIWIVWKVRAHHLALKKTVLDEAWREVLNDQNYMNRRCDDERKQDEARALMLQAPSVSLDTKSSFIKGAGFTTLTQHHRGKRQPCMCSYLNWQEQNEIFSRGDHFACM